MPATPATLSSMKLKEWMKNNLLLILTITGVILGLIIGLCLRDLSLPFTTILLLSYPGELFIRMLKLMILPLVIASLISGAASLNANINGSIVGKTIGYFLATSFFNAILGILLAVAIQPGSYLAKKNLDMFDRNTESTKANILDGFLDLGRNIFPDNIFEASFQQVATEYKEKTIMKTFLDTNGTEAMMNVTSIVRQTVVRGGTNTLGIIVFCLVFGTVLNSLGKRGAIVAEFFSVVDEVVLKIVTGIMWLSPVGVASVIIGKILSVEETLTEVMSTLAWFIFTCVIGVMIYQIFFQNLFYLLIVRKNPIKFYLNLLEPWVTSFATASTAATLPITLRCMNDKCGVDPRISRFVLPIGATVNMDGTALFVSVGSVFIAQISGRELNLGEYATIAVTGTAASVASASVPSAALFLILIVLSAVNLPAQDVSLFFTVDWLVDRFRTTNNMLGDCYTAAVVDKWTRDQLEAIDAEVKSSDSGETEKTDLKQCDSDLSQMLLGGGIKYSAGGDKSCKVEIEDTEGEDV